jgi:hypothetical protein
MICTPTKRSCNSNTSLSNLFVFVFIQQRVSLIVLWRRSNYSNEWY